MPTFNPTHTLSSGTYTGAYDWNDGANWTPNGVPVSGANLSINVTTSVPTYTSVDDVAALSGLDISLGNGVTLIVATGSTLGSATMNTFGNLARFEADGTVTFNAASAGNYIVKGSLTFDHINGASNFTIDGGSASFGINADVNTATIFNFNGIGSGQLTILDNNNYLNGWNYQVTNFTDLDKITLGQSIFTPGTYTSYNATAHTLTIPRSAGGNFIFNNFFLASGAQNEFLVTPTSIQNVCFVEGTRILTDGGEVAVEELREGARVVTLADGRRELRPIVWLGWRRLDLRRHPDPRMAAPVRFRRDAFAKGAPHRDLALSPDHSVFVDNKLIPAKLLVNGTTIVQELDRPSVRYFHVQLDRHAVLLSEGLPTESYLDTGNRAWFANAGTVRVAHPIFDFDASLECWQTDACAPLTVDAASVEPVWRRLSERAEALGYARQVCSTTRDAGLRFEADGRILRVSLDDRGRHVLAVPPGTRELRVVSRATAPNTLRPWLDDRRRLGVSVRRIFLRDNTTAHQIALDDPALVSGWWNIEQTADGMSRWTCGDAVLRLPEAASVIEMTVATLGEYALDAPAEALRATG